MLILASDGVWDVPGPADAIGQVVHVITSSVPAVPGPAAVIDETARRAAEALVETALRRGSRDNVAAVVALVSWPQ